MAGAAASHADPLPGEKTVSFIDGEGGAKRLATIRFAPQGDAATYQIEWLDAPFSNHFLSMRPFGCVEGVEKLWRRTPYPYDNRRSVTADDLTDLEYDLLFVWKGVGDYGIDMWNGVYYRLPVEGDRIVGRLHEMDMDLLSAPPESGDLRPVRESDLEAGDPDSHWLPVVVIE